MSRRVRLLVFSVVSFLAIETVALAQVPATAPTEKWEVSVHFGGLTATNPTAGVATLPSSGEPVALATGGSGPRVSSWLFGDGARLLNDVNAQLGIGVRVTPLDAVLGSSIVQSPGAMVFGFRVARMITRRVSAEVSVDYSPTGTRASDALSGALVATRTTFLNAVRPLLASAGSSFPVPFTMESGVGPGRGGQMLSTGALRIALPAVGPVTPFVVGGAGIASRFGELPGARVQASYGASFGFPACVCRLHERDEVSVRVVTPSRELAGLAGVGFDFQPSVRFWRGRAENRSRWGIRVDARVFFGATESETRIDTRPSFVEGPPLEDVPDYPYSGVLALGTSPTVQFSNNPAATGFDSSLSGQPLSNVRVFQGSGIRTRVALTTGVFVRF